MRSGDGSAQTGFVPRLAAATGIRARGRRGFTLIELLAALAIFGVISVLSLQAVSSAIGNRAHIEEEARRWRDLGRLFAAIETDLANAMIRPGLAFAGPAESGAGAPWLVFARAGGGAEDAWVMPPRGVSYRLSAGHVERMTSHALDWADGPDPIAINRFPLRVRALSVRYRTLAGDWVDRWTGAEQAAPRALELTVETPAGERVRRLFLIR